MTEDDFHQRETLLLSQIDDSTKRIEALQARLDANWICTRTPPKEKCANEGVCGHP